MALYLSPLVDVNEIDLSTTIPAVATSIAVLAIRDPYKGPELKKQLVTNVSELMIFSVNPHLVHTRTFYQQLDI